MLLVLLMRGTYEQPLPYWRLTFYVRGLVCLLEQNIKMSQFFTLKFARMDSNLFLWRNLNYWQQQSVRPYFYDPNYLTFICFLLEKGTWNLWPNPMLGLARIFHGTCQNQLCKVDKTIWRVIATLKTFALNRQICKSFTEGKLI